MNVLLSITVLWVLGVSIGEAYQLSDYIFPSEYRDYNSGFQKRSYYSPACTRCMHNPTNRDSCAYCFGRQTIVPYYGGYAKRAYDPSDLEDSFGKRAYDPGNLMETKRAFNPDDLFDEGKRAYDPTNLLTDKRAYNPSDLFEQKRAYDPSDLQAFEKRAYNPSDMKEWSGHMEKRGSFLYCKCCTALKDKYCCSKCPFKPFYEGKRSYDTGFQSSYSDCMWCNSGSFDLYACISCSKKRK